MVPDDDDDASNSSRDSVVICFPFWDSFYDLNIFSNFKATYNSVADWFIVAVDDFKEVNTLLLPILPGTNLNGNGTLLRQATINGLLIRPDAWWKISLVPQCLAKSVSNEFPPAPELYWLSIVEEESRVYQRPLWSRSEDIFMALRNGCTVAVQETNPFQLAADAFIEYFIIVRLQRCKRCTNRSLGA